MGNRYDIISVGGGHNGLTAAAYMAKAGKKVLVLERKGHPGGGVSTRELTLPGFWHDEHSNVHIMLQGNPLITEDELGLLSKFGLKYRYSPLPSATVFEDGSAIKLYKDLDRTCEGIAEFSPRDAEAYRRFAQKSMAFLPMFMSGLYAPPFPMGAFMAMMDQTDEGRDILDFMSRSSVDIVDQFFESERLKVHLVRLVTENLQAPDDLGTGMGVFLMPGIIHTYGVSRPIGGSGELTKAMIKAIEHFGGEVRCQSEVSRILTSSGRITGVELTTGERFEAKDAVIAGIHPKVLGRFVEGIPERVNDRAQRITQSHFSIMLSHYALKKQARLKAGGDLDDALMLELMTSDRMNDMRTSFDQLKQGKIPTVPLCAGSDIAVFDSSRAPAGSGTFYGVTFAPYDLEGNPALWDERKEEVADRSLAYYRRFFDGMEDDNILARVVKSPLDMERDSPNSFLRGDIHGCAPYMYQTVGHRPTPDYGNYTVPGVAGLYLVGPFMHPGGGVFGAGRGTAIRMMDDMNIDYDKVMGARV
ncbi:phytoene desaturase family protein [Rhizobium paknamense]|uniref:Pyridine nucleotide-disulfide oxidoreductase domain-containing protein 2 n=1 Tax=Rhizobium paknamense TaxID=1206817 RepID=A0ABU0IF74_9HYPH|nr:NAD(P)/FAD-dependent oxidoreductase [Rhizobium paknamense]MDQ0456806.1 phytoene dehydrogenase-like protein [Rhizobium paknamense]